MKRLKFCVLANCQTGPLSILIERICPTMERVRLPAIHTLDIKNPKFLWDVISKVEVIIHQPISDSFQELGINALKLKFPNKHYISFPSVYFDGYFPNLMYLRKPSGGTLKGVLGDYHDSRIIEGVISEQSTEVIFNKFVQKHSYEEVLNNINISLKNLSLRENDLDVKITSYIKENVFKKRLFYVFNHPVNEILIFIASRICDILNQKIVPEGIVSANNTPDYLSTTQAALDYSIIPFLESNDSNDSIYSFQDQSGAIQKFSINEFIEKQIDFYHSIVDLENLYEFALVKKIKMGY
jgi:hypothetical protein